jgi:hypothetical protein
MLSEAGAVACCGWLAACVYKILSWLRALFAEAALGVGAASTDSSQVDWVVVAVVVGANIWVVVFSGNHRSKSERSDHVVKLLAVLANLSCGVDVGAAHVVRSVFAMRLTSSSSVPALMM